MKQAKLNSRTYKKNRFSDRGYSSPIFQTADQSERSMICKIWNFEYTNFRGRSIVQPMTRLETKL